MSIPVNMFRIIAIALSSMLPLAVNASSLCESLTAQLAGQTNNISSTVEARKYAKAIANQNLQMRKITAAMRGIGCNTGSITIVGGVKEVQCDQFESALARMQTNLDILNSKRATALKDSISGPSRQRLARAIWENGCDVESDDGMRLAVKFEPGEDARETIRIPSDQEAVYDRFVDLGGAASSGALKTMCVRTCDGGFFPISSHASSLNFRRDAQVCSMMCPGTETELFYQSILSDETENMRSVETGQTYGDLPKAFSFRTIGHKAKAPSCGCNLTAYYNEMMRRENAIKNPARSEKSSSIIWSKPALRSTLQNEPALAAMSAAEVVEREYKPDPKIRRVGPQYLPDDEKKDRFPTRNPLAKVS